MRFIKAIIFCSGLFTALAIWADSAIKSPLDDYRKKFEIKILERRCDLNGDGVEDSFISDSRSLDGKAGNIWSVYISSKAGFLLLEDSVSFDHETFYCGRFDNLSGVALISYHAAHAGGGSLVAIQLAQGKVTEKVIKMLNFSKAEDVRLYEKTFKKKY